MDSLAGYTNYELWLAEFIRLSVYAPFTCSVSTDLQGEADQLADLFSAGCEPWLAVYLHYMPHHVTMRNKDKTSMLVTLTLPMRNEHPQSKA